MDKVNSKVIFMVFLNKFSKKKHVFSIKKLNDILLKWQDIFKKLQISNYLWSEWTNRVNSKLVFVVFLNPFLHTKNVFSLKRIINVVRYFEKNYEYQINHGLNK